MNAQVAGRAAGFIRSWWPPIGWTERKLRAYAPFFLFGLRVLASVSLALAVAFRLQLDEPSWAATSAAIVCQPTLGASLRKGRFRAIGTCLGAFAIVVLFAWFPQGRVGLLVSLAVWTALAGFAATLLRNNAAYAAALAGYTAVIVFTDAVAAPNTAFTLAVARATEISLGIVAAGIVLTVTDLGDARRRLGAEIVSVIDSVARGVIDTLSPEPVDPDPRTTRRRLIGRVVALDTIADEAIGESSALRLRSRLLQAGQEGLFIALSGWRTIHNHLEEMPPAAARREAAPVRAELRSLAEAGWLVRPDLARDACLRLARQVVRLPGKDPSARLLVERTAETLLALRRAINGLTLIAMPGHELPERGARWRLHVPDVMPALWNGLRVLLTVGLAELAWVVTAWPGGQSMVIFAAVPAILFSPRAEDAYATAASFALGTATAAVLAGIAEFAVLPPETNFGGLVLVIGLFLVPLAALSAGTWHKGFFTGASMNFVPLLGLTNQLSYDFQAYLNSALTIVAGVTLASVMMRLLPPLPMGLQIRRLLGLSLRDLRRLAAGRWWPRRDAWVGRLVMRLNNMPAGASTLDHAQLLAILSSGESMLWLRRRSPVLPGGAALSLAFGALAGGAVDAAHAELAQFAALQPSDHQGLRAQAEAANVMNVLRRHGPFLASAVRES
jgi:uncharacterized membrane protein YccC